MSGDEDVTCLPLTVHFHGQKLEFRVPHDITVAQLSRRFEDLAEVEEDKQKIMITPKPGIMKPPFPNTVLTSLLTPKSKITLLGSTSVEIKSLQTAIDRNLPRLRRSRGDGRNDKPFVSRVRDWQKVKDEAIYTFHDIQPLPYLPHPERSKRFLERLASDPGVKAAMRKHKFTVGLLTEMNPIEHTTRESKTLGLNRNRGEVIELRLRTDAYDGYRDYKVIRNTLCHELSHNVWGEHDRNFWELTKEIEKDVNMGDWKHGGHRLTDNEFYNPDDTGDDVEHDHGSWTGGEYVLGTDTSSSSNMAGLTRRDIIARAAQSRIEKQSRLEEESKEADDSRKETQ